MPVPCGDRIAALVAELVNVLDSAGSPGPTISLGLADDVPVVQLKAEGLTVAPAEDGEAVLKVSRLLLAGDSGAPGDETLIRYTADNGFERGQKVADRLLRGPTGQDR